MKTCTKCGETKKPEAFFVRNASPDGRTPRCKECLKEGARANTTRWRKNNPDRVRELARGHWHRNLEACRERGRRNHAAMRNKEGWKKHAADKAKQERARLVDSYVKQVLCVGTPLRAGDIPLELVELKREQLRLQRLAKQMEQAATKATTQENEE